MNERNRNYQSGMQYPRKHTKYREYAAHPIRFRDYSNIMNFLHVRLGHQSDRVIKLMFKHNMITFMKRITYDMIKDKHSTPCAACDKAKSTRRPSVINDIDIKSMQPFQIVCSDIIGKFDILSNKREHYAVLYSCLRTGHIAVYFIKTKDEIDNTIVRYLTNYVNRYNFSCKQLHSDYDTVYRASNFIRLLQDIGIYSTFSAPYHHQGNGVAERSVRKVLDLARTLMIEAQAAYSETDIYMALAVWYLNRTPNKKTGDKKPFELITGTKPDMKHCVPVGSKAYVHITDEEKPSRHKMAPRAVEGKLVGYAEDVYGGYIIKTKTGSIIVRRDVRFDDYSTDKKIFSENELNNIYNEDKWNEYIFSVRDEEVFNRIFRKNDNDNVDNSNHVNPKDMKTPNRNKFRRQTRSMTDNGIKINNYVLKPGEDPTKIVTPNNCYEALSDNNPYKDEWLKAINKEMETILQFGVFETVSEEEARNLKPFKSRIVFKVKIEADGTLIFKARLVVKGFSQRYGIDYDETFAPTVTFGTILLILHIAVTLGWHITGCDVGNAYLEALTNRMLYMELPTDYTGKEDKVVVRLIRNLYGSKQAVYMWYTLLCDILLKYGFIRSQYEPCCFIYNKNNKHVIICVYVDDLLIVGEN
jgi:hypothetical protein